MHANDTNLLVNSQEFDITTQAANAYLYLMKNLAEVGHFPLSDHSNGGASFAGSPCSATPACQIKMLK